MDINCYICNSPVDSINSGIKHLKDYHKIRENVHEIECFKKCEKKFQTFSGLRCHMKKCDFVQNTAIPLTNETDADLEQLAAYFEELGDEYEKENQILVCLDEKSDGSSATEEEEVDEHKCITMNFESPFGALNTFANKLIRDVNQLGLEYKKTDIIYKILQEIISKFTEININLIKSDPTNPYASVLNSTSKYMYDKFSDMNSNYKRQKIYEEDRLYVPPEEKAIGTRCEMKRDKDSHQAQMKVVQSTFQYASITKTLKALFEVDEFRNMYFDYNGDGGSNDGSRKKCANNNYTDFCCGSVYKNSDFFQMNPNAVQIQLYTDDFEILPMKSKANLHKCSAVYFQIKNMPMEYTYEMGDIYMVCMINANDVTTHQTDFNNIWELIVEDIKTLESDGLQIDKKTNLKGKHFFYCNIF